MQSQGCSQRSNSRDKVVKFTPIPMTYTELLLDLLKNTIVALCLARIIQPPYSRYYDANAKCEYHGGEVSHSTENCVKHSNIKCNLCSTQGGLLFKSRSRVWKRIPQRVMQKLRLAPMLIKWQQSSRSMEMKLPILCTLVFPMNKLAIGNL